MRRIRKHLHWAIPTLGLVTVFALVAWTGNPQQPVPDKQSTQDTVPAKRSKATREAGDKDLDKELRQLENGREKLKEVDWEKISKTVNEALENIDEDKIRLQVEQALKQVDMVKIQREVEESMKKIDFDKIQKEVSESLKNSYAYIDKEALKKQIDEAKKEVEKEMKNKDWEKEIEEVKKINKEEIEKEMEKVQEEMKKVKTDLSRQKLDMRETMEKAQEGLAKAREEIKGYQEMIYGLEKEGLLSTKGDYTIEYNKGDLTINGKKQPQEVADKYKKYFRKDNVTIRKKDGEMHLDHDYDDYD
jgi:chromosome segregation ATPase